jgi:hypothetical protein
MLATLGCGVTALVLVCTTGLGFLAALARALHSVSPENRRMEPVRVWLNLIPIFNFVWATVTVERVAESLRNEFRERGMDGPAERYGRSTGLTVVILLAVGLVFSPAFVPFRRASVYPALIIFVMALGNWVAYWKQINGYVRRLKSDEYVPPPVDEGW